MVGLADARLRLERPVTASVVIEVVPTKVQRALLNVPVRIRNAGPGLSAQVVPPVVTVLTEVRRKSSTSCVRTRSRRTSTLPASDRAGTISAVRVDPPQDVEVVRTDPATVRVNIGR